ncbi:MAG: hypothetical protein JRH20_16565 [Deltaproteobacteria bacterium]|nr:hypothetical protein [Deltaproteobacteria bacterium]
MRVFATLCCLLCTLSLARLAKADGLDGVQPLRSISDYTITRYVPRVGEQRFLPQAERVEHLAHAKVALADYGAIRRDFFAGRQITNAEIDRWLLAQVAFVSSAQTQQTIFNESISTRGGAREAHRPRAYGRGLVFEVFDPADSQHKLGLIDSKGNGFAKMPKRKNNHCSHCNGLMTLGEALREFSYERMVNKVQKHAASGRTTVNSYAVISAGFSIKQGDGSRAPAALYLRQAHRRGLANSGDLGRQRALLEHYGINAGFAVQGTPEGHLVDFGDYLGMPAKSAYALPLKLWGAPGKQDPQADNPWRWGHETAEAFAAGRAKRHHVWLFHRKLLDSMEARLARTSQTRFEWAKSKADPIRAWIQQLSTSRPLAAKRRAAPPAWQSLRMRGRRPGTSPRLGGQR